MTNHHKRRSYILIIIIAVLGIATFFYFRTGFQTITSTIHEVTGSRIPEDVARMLADHDINLEYLRRIETGLDSNDILFTHFIHDNNPAGYMFVYEKNPDSSDEHIMLDFRTYYNGLPVMTHGFRIHLYPNRPFNTIFAQNITFGDISVSPDPTISLGEARKIISRDQSSLRTAPGVLGYYDNNASSGGSELDYRLVWLFDFGAQGRVDAHTGEILYSFDGIYN